MAVHILANKKIVEKLNLKEDIFKFHYERHKDYVYDLIIATSIKEIIKLEEYTPILYLTEQYNKEEALKVFNKGVADYQLLSIDRDILVTKIKLLTRYNKKIVKKSEPEEFKEYKIGSYTFNNKERIIYYKEEKIGKLGKTAFRILILLYKKLNTTVDIMDICRIIWGDDYIFNRKSLMTMRMHIYFIRRVLNKDSKIFILSIYEDGYKLIVRKN